MLSTRKRTRALVLVLACAGLAWLLHKIGFAHIADSLNRIGLAGAICLTAAGAVEALFDGWALQQAALNRISFWKALLINQTGAFVNMAAPVEAGEILKAALLSRHTKEGAASAILVWNMAARLAKSAIIFAGTTLALLFLTSWRRQSAICWSFALLNIGVYVTLALIFRKGGVGRALRLLTRLPLSFLRSGRAKELVARVQNAEAKTAQFRHEHPGRYAAVLVSQACARTAGLVTTWLALRFMAHEYSLLLSILIFSAMELAGYVVALLPTRVGTLESSAFLIFNFLGLGGGAGAILQLVLRIKQLIVTGSFVLIGTVTFKSLRDGKDNANLAHHHNV